MERNGSEYCLCLFCFVVGLVVVGWLVGCFLRLNQNYSRTSFGLDNHVHG